MKSPFRSIRQKLFNEGKLVRYLGYAVGEIALIIIGILFALKINNMNEDRKEQVEFDLYIVQLREDVRIAVEGVRSVQELNKRMAVQDYSIIEFLNRSEFNSEELTSFEEALRTLGRYSEPQIEIGFLGELLQGNTEIISRDQSLYRQAQTAIYRLKSSLSTINHVLEATLLRHVKADVYRGVNNRQLSDLPVVYDLDQLQSSSEFNFTTRTTAAQLMSASTMSGGLAETLEDFLAVLEEYE
jgi:hypothetical protein